MAARHSAEGQAAGAARERMGAARYGERWGGERTGGPQGDGMLNPPSPPPPRRGAGGLGEGEGAKAAGLRASEKWTGAKAARGRKFAGRPEQGEQEGRRGEGAEWRRCGGEAAGTGGL